MRRSQAHLSDEELLLFSDQELPIRPASKVRQHVAQCESCRGRLTELESASARFADLHEREIRAQNSHSFNSRNLLRARISETSIQARRLRSVTSLGAMTQQLASACLALLLVIGGTWAVRHIARARSDSGSTRVEAIALPRRALTPGSTRAVKVSDLCGRQDLDNDPPVNPSMEQAVLNEYGVPAASKNDYELDYLIAPALGGADNLQNLWPQPYSSTWNARVKDQLEDHLHELVCQGKVQLVTAQNDIALDWIAAYKRYFNTDKPEPTSTTAVNVSPRNKVDPSHRIEAQSRISSIYDLALVEPAWPLPVTRTVHRRAGWLR